MVPGLEDDDKCRQNRLHDCHQIEIPFIFSVPKTWKTALIRAVFYVFTWTNQTTLPFLKYISVPDPAKWSTTNGQRTPPVRYRDFLGSQLELARVIQHN